METQSLEGLPTKAREDPSPHEMRLSPAGRQPSISWFRLLLLLLLLLLLQCVSMKKVKTYIIQYKPYITINKTPIPAVEISENFT